MTDEMMTLRALLEKSSDADALGCGGIAWRRRSPVRGTIRPIHLIMDCAARTTKRRPHSEYQSGGRAPRWEAQPARVTPCRLVRGRLGRAVT
jgi:hypothetical protein